jgi:glycosyltransferase involved in cell wall biosynthesis
MNPPVVSVVMAAKNYARFLPVAVESVFAQTFDDWELLVIDDGSTDHTPAAVRPFLPDRRVRYFRSDKLGQPRAKNLGVRLGRGEFVAFLDADDAWEPTKLGKQLALFRDRPEVGVVFCRRSLIDERGNDIPRRESSSQGRRNGIRQLVAPPTRRRNAADLPRKGGGEKKGASDFPDLPPCGGGGERSEPAGGTGGTNYGKSPALPRGRVLPHLFVQNFVCFSSAVVRRAALSHVGAFDPQWDLAIDYDLWLRVARHYEFDFVDEELVKYRTGHGNLSKKLADRVDTALSIMHRAESRYGVAEEVPADRVAEAHASTCRTLAYVMRPSEPATAARWYLRALRWPAGRVASVRGLIAAVLRLASGRRIVGSPENATENR